MSERDLKDVVDSVVDKIDQLERDYAELAKDLERLEETVRKTKEENARLQFEVAHYKVALKDSEAQASRMYQWGESLAGPTEIEKVLIAYGESQK